jgi:hypothetical protein
MKIFEKGTSVHATDVYFVSSKKLYVDAAKTVEAKRSNILDSIASGKILINNGTDYLTVTSVKLDGSAVVVGETTFSIAADA